MMNTTPGNPTTDEQRKEAHQDGTNFVEDEKEFLKDEEFENNVRELMVENFSLEEKERLTMQLRRETANAMPAEYKKKLKERKEAALRGVHIELDENMKKELRTTVARLYARIKNIDNETVRQIDANIQRTEDRRAARLKEEEGKLKAEEKSARKGTKQSEEIFNKRLRSVSSRKSTCCELF